MGRPKKNLLKGELQDEQTPAGNTDREPTERELREGIIVGRGQQMNDVPRDLGDEEEDEEGPDMDL